MGRLRKIFELANGKLPSYNSAFVKLRGIAHPLDTFLSGRLRFARKLGSPLPIWLPENQTQLAESVTATKDRIVVTEVNSWFQIGSKLLIDGRSTVFIEDILNGGRTLALTEPLIVGYPAGTTVDLYGHPLEVFGTFSPPEATTPVPDDFVRSLDPRGSVVAVSDIDVAVLAGELTIDGFITTAGDLVLLTNQADPTLNGMWEVSVFAWARPSVFEGGSTASRAHVFSIGGNTYANTSWVCTATSGSDIISDPLAIPPIVGNPLTWAQLSTVVTFLVHSDQPIYPGDVINYKFGEYDVSEATPVGTTIDGRTTYQITIDIGISDTLEDGSTTQIYLRAFPSYESQNRPLPNIPITENNIGPFLYDRISGSFYEDLDVEEIDIVTLSTSSNTRIFRQKNAGKNYLVYNVAIPSDSFLFWELARGRLNWSRTNQNFVAFMDDEGKFHLYYHCIPEIPHVQGFEGWRVQITPEVDTRMVVQFEPNSVLTPFTTRPPGGSPPPPPPPGGVFMPAGVVSSVNIDFPAGSQDIGRIHITFDSGVPDSRVDMKSWEIRGLQTTAFISHATIAKVTGRNVWASSSAFAKPYWLRLTYLEVQTDLYSRFNAGLLAL